MYTKEQQNTEELKTNVHRNTCNSETIPDSENDQEPVNHQRIRTAANSCEAACMDVD